MRMFRVLIKRPELVTYWCRMFWSTNASVSTCLTKSEGVGGFAALSFAPCGVAALRGDYVHMAFLWRGTASGFVLFNRDNPNSLYPVQCWLPDLKFVRGVSSRGVGTQSAKVGRLEQKILNKMTTAECLCSASQQFPEFR